MTDNILKKEQDIIDSIWPDDNTKTIDDAWEFIQQRNTHMTLAETKTYIKNILNNITNWSS